MFTVVSIGGFAARDRAAPTVRTGNAGGGSCTTIASNALAPKIPLKAFSAHRNTPIVALSHVLNSIQY